MSEWKLIYSELSQNSTICTFHRDIDWPTQYPLAMQCSWMTSAAVHSSPLRSIVPCTGRRASQVRALRTVKTTAARCLGSALRRDAVSRLAQLPPILPQQHTGAGTLERKPCWSECGGWKCSSFTVFGSA